MGDACELIQGISGMIHFTFPLDVAPGRLPRMCAMRVMRPRTGKLNGQQIFPVRFLRHVQCFRTLLPVAELNSALLRVQRRGCDK